MNSSTPKHVIFGTGPLGQAVLREIIRRGQPVRMVNRSGRTPAGVPEMVEVTACDAYDARQVQEVTRGAAVVYQCAQPPYQEWVEKFPALQASILEGAAANGAKLIAGENLYMYGEVDGPIHEGLPSRAHTRKGKVRAQMSEQLFAAHRAGTIRAAAARGADFYGPGVTDSTFGERIFKPILAGKNAQAIGNVDLPHTYTVVDDFGKAMVMLGEREEALGQAWHVPNPPTLTTRQLVALAFQQLGREPKVSGMGRLMMSIGGIFIPEAREMVEMMYEFEKPFVVDHSKFEKTFGNVATPHEEAIRETLAWYRGKAIRDLGNQALRD